MGFCVLRRSGSGTSSAGPKTPSRRGFTLVELLVALVVLAVVAAIVLPRFAGAGLRAKEAAVKTDLKLIRQAIDRFRNDTGAWPNVLKDLAATSAPAEGRASDGNAVDIDPDDWHGPYLDSLPKDPIARADYDYGDSSPGVGTVRSSAGEGVLSSDGSEYDDW